MTDKNGNSQRVKISPQFRARLNSLEPEQKVRAIVMLRADDIELPSSQEQARSNRQSLIKSIQQAARTAIPDIDKTLKRFNGKRLSSNVNALGAIQVETTAAGIVALAASEHVKVILEDQAISSLPKLKRA